VFTGAGKVYAAGDDFNRSRGATENFNGGARQWKEARERVYGIINCHKPVVSAMRGVAVGAGLVCGILAIFSPAIWTCFGKVESSRMSAEELDDAPATVYERI